MSGVRVGLAWTTEGKKLRRLVVCVCVFVFLYSPLFFFQSYSKASQEISWHVGCTKFVSLTATVNSERSTEFLYARCCPPPSPSIHQPSSTPSRLTSSLSSLPRYVVLHCVSPVVSFFLILTLSFLPALPYSFCLFSRPWKLPHPCFSLSIFRILSSASRLKPIFPNLIATDQLHLVSYPHCWS